LKLLNLITLGVMNWRHRKSAEELGVLSGADAFDLALSGVAGCLGTTLPVAEAAYEVAFSMGSDRTIDGPKKGRMRAAEAVCYVALAVIQHRSPFMDLS